MARSILLSVLAGAIFWSTAILFAQEQAPAPSFKEGDTWHFNISRKGQFASSTVQNEGMYELCVSQADVNIYELNGSEKNEVPPHSRRGLLGLIKESNQRPNLKFPLSVGQKWTYEYDIRPGRYRQRRSVEINVVGMEQVTTAAGSFKAYKLMKSESWTVNYKRGRMSSSTTTEFYSPETRSIVKSSSNVSGQTTSGTIETELIKFTPGS